MNVFLSFGNVKFSFSNDDNGIIKKIIKEKITAFSKYAKAISWITSNNKTIILMQSSRFFI